MPRTLATALLLATLAAPASALPPCGPPETVWNACVGEYRLENGATYVGEWRDGKRHGRGTLYGPDGRVLQQGVWIDGRFAYPF
ncbi:MAG: hypothetical protein ACO38S_06915 [Gemmobacter sp.]